MARALGICSAVLLLVALPASASSRSGAYGTLTRGPIAPVCVAGQPCSAPVPGALIRFSAASSGRVMAEARTHGDGTYRVILPPGRYTIRLVPQRRLSPTMLVVSAGRFAHRDLSIDTGIR